MLKITRFGDVTRFDLARTIAGQGRYWTTAYWVDGLMIDTGCAYTAGELVESLAGMELAGIVNTHSHEDHIGANGRLQRLHPGLTIRAHPLALPILKNPDRQYLHPYRKILWGRPEPSQGSALSDGGEVHSERYRFRILYTPGHSADHLCLYEPDRGWLFSGDLFVGGQDRTLRAGYDIWGIIASLKRVAGLPATMLFPGSARVRDDPAQALAGKINYLESMGQQVKEMHQAGQSVNEIARTLFDGPLPVELITLGHFSRRRLVLAYLGQNEE